MITKIDSNNVEQYNAYQQLFAEAMKELKETKPNVTINSLETYFSHIKDLINIDRKYSMLPLQEQYFEIDANARTITVPDIFRKNGLGVQGDKTAETIYFKINRYFDAMDLNQTDIYIRWENANNDSGFSTEWVRDIETFDDYMVFGWVLGNTITETPGPLKFSISFIKTTPDKKTVTYALNTLTAQAIINSSLDFPIGTPDDSLNDLLAGNILNTTTTTDSEIKIFEFVYNFNNLLLEDNSNLENNIISANLIQKENEYSLELLVSAYANIGDLSYQLYKQVDEQPDISNDTLITDTMTSEYKPVEYDTALTNRRYYQYKRNDNGDIQYDAENNPIYEYVYIAPGTTGIKNKYFEKYGSYKLKKDNNTSITGIYYGTAISKINEVNSSPIYTLYQVKVPGPEEVIFNSNIEYSGHAINTLIISEFSKNAEDTVTNYKWYKANEDVDNKYVPLEEASSLPTYTPTEKGFYRLKVTTSRNLDNMETFMKQGYCVTEQPTEEDIKILQPTAGGIVISGTTPKIIATFEPEEPIAEYGLSYQWQNIIQENGEKEYIDIEGATTNSYTLIEKGTYVCKVIATYNGLQAYKYSVEFIIE